MLPDMTALYRKFPYMFPDRVTAQLQGTQTTTARGVVLPGIWADVDTLKDMPCLIESTILTRNVQGETLTEVGQTSEDMYNIAFDRVISGLTELHRLKDQNGVIYEVKQVVRDDHGAATILKGKVYTGQ